MLEQATLQLLPWQWTTPEQLPALWAPAWVRRVGTLDRQGDLGFIRVVQRPAWWRLGPQHLEVNETEDASLLLSLQRGWFALGPWRVFDAEQRRIGAVLGAHLLDDRDFRFATRWQDSAVERTIRTISGAMLARLVLAADGAMQLHLHDESPANPFLRMVLLAAAVVAQPLPR